MSLLRAVREAAVVAKQLEDSLEEPRWAEERSFAQLADSLEGGHSVEKHSFAERAKKSGEPSERRAPVTPNRSLTAAPGSPRGAGHLRQIVFRSGGVTPEEVVQLISQERAEPWLLWAARFRPRGFPSPQDQTLQSMSRSE